MTVSSRFFATVLLVVFAVSSVALARVPADSAQTAVVADSLASVALDSATHSTPVAVKAKKENTVDVLEKLQNHAYLDFKPIGKVELPRIFYTNRGILFFGSTTAAINAGVGLTDEHFVHNAAESHDGIVHPVTYHVVSIDPELVIKLDLSISSHLVYFWVAGFLTLFVFLAQVRRYKSGFGRTSAPKGALQNLLETLVVFIRDEVAKPNIGEKHLKFTPYLLTAFFMILFMNLFGLVPWGVSSTADVTVTAVLALTTFLVTQVSASKDHWAHVFWFPGVPAWIRIILTPVELIGLITKPFALCIRLFANMASGKVLIYSIIGLIFVFYNLFGAGVAYGTSWLWVLFALFIFVIKVVVAFLQAYIFTMLSSLFIGMAVAEHHHEEHAH